DRVSAYDVVMAEPIPLKGAVLTQVSAWWFRQLGDTVKHHMISADADEIIAQVPALRAHRAALAGRAMLCRRGTVFPHGCVIRRAGGGANRQGGAPWRERGCRAASRRADGSIRRSSRRRPRPRAGTTRTSRSAACARCWAAR